MGMPLISTTFACSGIAVQEGKQVLFGDTPEVFVDQVLRVLANPALRADLADRGRQLVCQRYSWSVIGRNLHSAYSHAALRTT
jgi:glycosyltransferase involved in cell wall biosynthesis